MTINAERMATVRTMGKLRPSRSSPNLISGSQKKYSPRGAKETVGMKLMNEATLKARGMKATQLTFLPILRPIT